MFPGCLFAFSKKGCKEEKCSNEEEGLFAQSGLSLKSRSEGSKEEEGLFAQRWAFRSKVGFLLKGELFAQRWAFAKKEIVVLSEKLARSFHFWRSSEAHKICDALHKIKISAHRQITQVYVIHASLRESTLVYVSLGLSPG